MMNNEILYISIFMFSVFISSVSQIILKKSANEKHESGLGEYLNPMVIIAYSIFFISTLITIIANKFVPLSIGPIIESLGYVFVSVLGVLFLNEKIKGKKLCGLIIIILGVIIFNLGVR